MSAFGDDDIAHLDAWLQTMLDDRYPSLSVAIVRDGEIVYQGAFGFEDIKAGRPATPQTQYHVASVTKAFTASLAVILHERGVVDLDQPVVKYLPDDVSISTTPELGATITLRQLASHTSGLPRGVPGRVQSVEGWYQLEPQRLYDHLANVELKSDPGAAEEYSNLGFGLLGHALERAADKPFDRLMQELLCDPLKLERTAIQADDTLRLATGYSRRSHFERKHSYKERLAASGGLVASVEDLAKFLAAQMRAEVFSSEMLDQLHTETKLSDGYASGSALGWSVRSRESVGRILKKNGGRSNCSAWIGFAPELGVGVAVVTNCGGPDVDPIGYKLLEQSVPLSRKMLVTKNGCAKVAPYTGVRWEGNEPEVKIGEEWSKLVSLNDLPAADIVAFSQRTYGDLWRKRFEEDLVELLAGMGHEPKDTVQLVVSAIGSQETRTLEDVPMTRANRQAIRNAAQAREDGEPEQGTRRGVPIDDEAPLAELVPSLREANKLVGLAAMVAVDGKVVASAVDGERKIGSGVPLEIGDRWHLGSVTKSITATMIARLVESGQMKWTDTIGECFPDATIHDDWKPVTVKQLLTHTAGAAPNFSLQVRLKQPALGPECTLARREAVLDVLAEKPIHPPGEKHAYSNVGYTIAGAMAEKVTGAAWEDLVKREVFEPLELTGAGFGPPKSPDETLEQPRGHRTALGRKFAMGDDADNTPIMGPAGTVHMTLSDLCTYATEHLRGDLGAGKLLSAETYKLLHTPELDQYACGWVRIEPNAGIPYTVYWHNGSNTMWYALVVFIPETNMVVAVAANDGDVPQAEAAAWKVVWANVAASEWSQTAEYAKKSPFAAVRWQDSQPEIRLGEEWFKLVSLDDLPAEEIVAFSRETYGNKWQKRFEEDLVELLTRMGHPPQDKVKLVIQSLTSSETHVREGVAMTEANRWAIKAAAESPSIPLP